MKVSGGMAYIDIEKSTINDIGNASARAFAAICARL